MLWLITLYLSITVHIYITEGQYEYVQGVKSGLEIYDRFDDYKVTTTSDYYKHTPGTYSFFLCRCTYSISTLDTFYRFADLMIHTST